MSQLPTGTVTRLFTDSESVTVPKQPGSDYSSVLTTCRSLLRELYYFEQEKKAAPTLHSLSENYVIAYRKMGSGIRANILS